MLILFLFSDILPYNTDSERVTREFLQRVIDILLDFVKATNDRNEKILDFHHPEEMIKLLDLRVPEQGVSLQQLVNDCATTLKYQVKTGNTKVEFISLFSYNSNIVGPFSFNKINNKGCEDNIDELVQVI